MTVTVKWAAKNSRSPSYLDFTTFKMRNLAADIVTVAAIFEPPLVMPFEGAYVVFDGNRRVTCLKLLRVPGRAPTADLRTYFERLGDGREMPGRLTCQVEEDRTLIDSILFRRHTGSQQGVGQLDWNGARSKISSTELVRVGGSISLQRWSVFWLRPKSFLMAIFPGRP